MKVKGQRTERSSTLNRLRKAPDRGFAEAFRQGVKKMGKARDPKSLKAVRHEAGVTYFTREAERRLFFFLTIIMLILGIVYKIGWL
jgi:hypothetical protein